MNPVSGESVISSFARSLLSHLWSAEFVLFERRVSLKSSASACSQPLLSLPGSWASA